MSKKILFITNSYPVPDYRRLWKKATSLANDEYQVTIICPSGNKNPGHRKLKGIQIYYFRKYFTRNNFITFFLGELVDLVKVGLLVFVLYLRREFSVLHLVNPSETFLSICLLYKIIGYKFVYEINEAHFEKYRLSLKKITIFDRFWIYVLKITEKIGLKTADLIIVPDYFQKTRLLGLISKRKNKIITIEYLPDLKDFFEPLLNRDYKRGFPFMVLYAGSMKIERGLLKLLRVIELLVNKFNRSDILFVLAGSGKGLARIKEEASAKGLAGYIYFPGWLTSSKLLEYLTAADLGVAPEPVYNHRGVPRDYVLEYMAVGKPIVSYNSCTVKNRIGQAGSFIAEANEIEFAREIVRILDDKKVSRLMGESGRRKVARELNWTKSEIKLLASYQKLFEKKSVFNSKNLARSLTSKAV